MEKHKLFLNCNYPNKCKIPKGRPKELKKIKLEMKKGKIRLIVDKNNNVWFAEDERYWGIALPKFIIKSIWGVDVFKTICKINTALLDWGYGRNAIAVLSNKQEDLLTTYLLTIR